MTPNIVKVEFSLNTAEYIDTYDWGLVCKFPYPNMNVCYKQEDQLFHNSNVPEVQIMQYRFKEWQQILPRLM